MAGFYKSRPSNSGNSVASQVEDPSNAPEGTAGSGAEIIAMPARAAARRVSTGTQGGFFRGAPASDSGGPGFFREAGTAAGDLNTMPAGANEGPRGPAGMDGRDGMDATPYDDTAIRNLINDRTIATITENTDGDLEITRIDGTTITFAGNSAEGSAFRTILEEAKFVALTAWSNQDTRTDDANGRLATRDYTSRGGRIQEITHRDSNGRLDFREWIDLGSGTAFSDIEGFADGNALYRTLTRTSTGRKATEVWSIAVATTAFGPTLNFENGLLEATANPDEFEFVNGCITERDEVTFVNGEISGSAFN